jgi:CNT family concentrative nucleoside transporter
MRTAILVVFLMVGAAAPSLAGAGPDAEEGPPPNAVNLAPAVKNAPDRPDAAQPLRTAPIRDLGDRVRGLLGAMLILGVALYLSDDRGAVSLRVVFWGLVLPWIMAVLVLRVPAGVWLVREAGAVVERAVGVSAADVDRGGRAGLLFPIIVLPTVVFASVLSAVLYRLGIMQRVTRGFAASWGRLLGISGAESLDVAVSMTLGQTEAPLAIRPYLSRLTNSELLTVATVGMANVSSIVMAAAYLAFGIEPRLLLTAVLITTPSAVLISKLLVPETRTSETLTSDQSAITRPDGGWLASVWRGTRDGLRMAFFITAALVAAVGCVALIDLILAPFGASLEEFLGWAMAPIAYMIGVAWEDCRPVGWVLGTKTAFNELVAFQDLVRLRGVILDRSFVIASFALCGFANLGSLGIQLGGLGALAPERRGDLARLGIRALLAATLANFLTACIAGVLF